MSDELRAATFRTHLHTSFDIHLSPLAVLEVELVEVTEKGALDRPPPSGAARQERFSIVFRGPRDQQLPQGTYQLQHTHLRGLALFLVPVGQDQAGVYYEAVFNRLWAPDA